MSIKYNEFGEVISVNGLTTGHHLGAPMQDAQAERPEDNEVYAIQHSTVTNCKNTIEDAKPKPGGASSWNDLEDKPFYEETTTVGGDTLTWDGNTEGLEDLAGSPVYRVSSAAPSIEDCAKGGTIKYSYNGQAMEGTFAAEDVVSAGVYFQIFTMGVGLVFVVPADTTVEGVTLHAGTYLINHNGAVVNSLTIPNSNAFVTTKTVVKPIETKYLPEHLHFGEEKAFEPIVWDGSAEGRETLEGGALVHISSQKINPAIIENLVFCNSETGERQAITDFQVRQQGAVFELQGGLVMLVNDPSLGASEGVWATPKGALPVYLSEINPKNTVKPMDEKYMPVLTSPGGKKFKLSVDDSGAITAVEV